MSVEDAADATRPAPAPTTRKVGSAPTIYDVARVAGVNPSTVSRALSRPGRVSSKTEQRILSAAEELNYRINPMARALPTGKTRTIGVMVADITNPVFATAVRGAERAAGAAGYVLILVESQESAEREAEAAERVLPSVDALVLVSSRLSNEQIRALSARKRLVVLNREVEDVESLVPDFEPGLVSALQHLASLGHRSVAYLAGPSTSWMSSARWRTLLRTAPELGMTIVEMPTDEPTVDGGRAALERVRASGVTAVVAYNDLIAIGLLQSALGSGLEVPGDLSIVGVDDIFGSDFTSPPLTTIRMPLADLGDRAVRIALGEDAPSTPETESVLVVRGSTGAARA